MRSALPIVWGLVCAVGACGDDDSSNVDAMLTVDSVAADGASLDGPSSTTTTCGSLSCDRATEVCVSCECGGPTSFACEPIPAGCSADRTCDCLAPTLCAPTAANPYAMCFDLGDNQIDCDRGLD